MDKKLYLLQCGIRLSWHDKSLDDFTNDEEALGVVKSYLNKADYFLSKGVGLYLWGANGTGKSMLLNCSFKRLLNRYSVHVFALPELISEVTASWYSDDSRADLVSLLRRVQFLGIDEFGRSGEEMPSLFKRVLEDTIRYRVQMRKPIWFTSNMEPRLVKDNVSESIASLLREAVLDVCVRGDDYRRIIARQIREDCR